MYFRVYTTNSWLDTSDLRELTGSKAGDIIDRTGGNVDLVEWPSRCASHLALTPNMKTIYPRLFAFFGDVRKRCAKGAFSSMIKRKLVFGLTACAIVLGALALTATKTFAQCVDCAPGCTETISSLQYNNHLCSCPTGSICVDSGGTCYSCGPGGLAYCYDTTVGCGGFYNNNQTNCGCATTCPA